MFRSFAFAPFADRHADVWRWAEQIEPDKYVEPFVAIWPRGGGKSTNAEMIATDLGARGKRRYCWYVCGTQEQADKHVSSIGAILESDGVTQYFPEVGQPRIGKNGNRSWNRTVVRCSNGFSVEAVGLNKQIRGGKIEESRPDLIILDDIDDTEDTDLTISKKTRAITQKILPSGANDVAVLFVQNLIHSDSIASTLADTSASGADWLAGRIVSGPHPAVKGLQYEIQPTDQGAIKTIITAGEATWEGQDLTVSQHQINTWGISAFLTESQHELDRENPSALWSKEILDLTRVSSHPPLEYIAVAVDPPASVGTCGIIGGGRARVGKDMHGYTVADYTTPAGVKPDEWALLL
jgi:hypothetical protein